MPPCLYLYPQNMYVSIWIGNAVAGGICFHAIVEDKAEIAGLATSSGCHMGLLHGQAAWLVVGKVYREDWWRKKEQLDRQKFNWPTVLMYGDCIASWGLVCVFKLVLRLRPCRWPLGSRRLHGCWPDRLAIIWSACWLSSLLCFVAWFLLC